MELNTTNSTPETRRKLAFRVENPFTLKVGQVFTGFGIGCGVGIGVGSPLNLGAIPMLQQVTSAARGATDAFSGIGRHANSTLRRLGVKRVEMGIGCGVGFGHGFGAGIAVKPGVVHHLQSCFAQALVKLMTKFGSGPGLLGGQSMVAESLKSKMNMVNSTETLSPLSNAMQLALSQEHTSQGQANIGNLFVESTQKQLTSNGAPLDSPFGSHTEKVISSFLQNPILKDERDTEPKELVGRLRGENDVLQLVLKHQQVINTLIAENEKLRQVLIEELKVPASKLEAHSVSGVRSQNPCSDCFECRRRQRKLR